MYVFKTSIIIGLFAALALWTVTSQAPRIETDIYTRADAVAGMLNMNVVANGRDLVLQGRIRTHADPSKLQTELAALMQSIQQLTGVRHVRANIEMLGPNVKGGEAALMMRLAGTATDQNGES